MGSKVINDMLIECQYPEGPLQVGIFESCDEINSMGLVGFGVSTGLMLKIIVFLWSWKS